MLLGQCLPSCCSSGGIFTASQLLALCEKKKSVFSFQAADPSTPKLVIVIPRVPLTTRLEDWHAGTN